MSQPDKSVPLIPVLLAGGSGSRLWPLSRSLYPKQFLPLASSQSMLQETVSRLEPLIGLQPPITVCNEEHRFLVAEQLRETGHEGGPILLEPEGRNTAPAIALAALQAEQSSPGSLLLVMPADHVIEDARALVDAVEASREQAQEGALVTFGIVPTAPETGFGYIRLAQPPQEGEEAKALPVAEFVEKPNAGQAREFVESGLYFWNSGMFLFRADAYLDQLGRYAPAILEACRQAFEGGKAEQDFVRVRKEAFAASPADSIDYAVMEKTDAAYMAPLHLSWSDVGSWAALYEVSPKDEAGNVIRGDVLSAGDRNCYLRAESRLVATAGLEGHVVVETADAVLVAHKDHAQEVKGLVQELEKQDRSECAAHKTVYRPWGSYEQMACGERFQVKHIFVKPGEKLSLQMHHHRAEHWVVVKGTAKVHLDGEEFLVSEDQSTYVPIGCTHRVENPGSIPLELIEVQTGSYLGEDDIVRFEDNYGR